MLGRNTALFGLLPESHLLIKAFLHVNFAVVDVGKIGFVIEPTWRGGEGGREEFVGCCEKTNAAAEVEWR
jgi:hypothetical protein